jgi:hypothetical protein
MTVHRHLLTAALAALALAGCSAAPPAPPPDVSLAAPGPAGAQPIDAAELTPGTLYRFADVLPGVLDMDLTVAQPEVFPYSGPSFAYLTGDQDGTTDVVTVLAADDVAMLNNPLRLPTPDTGADPASQLKAVAPGRLLAALTALPFLQVTKPAGPVTIAGLNGTAIDVRSLELPAEATSCGPGAPRCAGLLGAPNHLQYVVAGQELRLAQLDHPAGRLLVVQNLQEPRAQAVLDAVRFVPHALAPELGGATSLPYSTSPLDGGRTYGAALDDVGVGATFTVGGAPSLGYTRGGANISVISADVPSDLAEPAPFGYVAGREKLVGYVAPAGDLLVPEPGVDPRRIGPKAYERSAGSTAGLVEIIARQPWAEVVTPAVDTTVGGLAGRAIEVRLRTGAGSVPCTVSKPADGSCAVLLYSKGIPSMWLLSERVLRVADVSVGGPMLTVVSGTDEAGRAFSDSLKLVKLAS